MTARPASVSCPLCQAKVGVKCVSSVGNPVASHRQRRQKALMAGEYQPVPPSALTPPPVKPGQGICPVCAAAVPLIGWERLSLVLEMNDLTQRVPRLRRHERGGSLVRNSHGGLTSCPGSLRIPEGPVTE